MIIAYTYSYVCREQFFFHINFVPNFQSFVQVHFGGPFICYHPVNGLNGKKTEFLKGPVHLSLFNLATKYSLLDDWNLVKVLKFT